jgi:hypothetical protein
MRANPSSSSAFKLLSSSWFIQDIRPRAGRQEHIRCSARMGEEEKRRYDFLVLNFHSHHHNCGTSIQQPALIQLVLEDL